MERPHVHPIDGRAEQRRTEGAQAVGDREIDARREVISLGAVVHEMLAGEIVGPGLEA